MFGLREVFLNRAQKDTLSKWIYTTESDRSILGNTFHPAYELFAQLIPHGVSPNILSLMGILCAVLAWEWSTRENLGTFELCIISLALVIYHILDKIDGRHARNTLNSSPLGEIIEQFGSCIAVTFISAIVCNVFFISGRERKLTIFMFNCIAMAKHVEAFAHPKRKIIIGNLTRTGPTERLVLLCTLVSTRNIWFQPNLSQVIFGFVAVAGVAVTIRMLIQFQSYYKIHRDYTTLTGIIVCFTSQVLKAQQSRSSTEWSALENGIIFSTLCGDLIISKMAQRPLSPLIPVIQMVCVAYEHASFPLAVFYFGTIVFDVASHLKLSILNPVRNLLVTGYYDGLHEGHIASLNAVSRFGNRLVVGVHSDEDYYRTKYKPEKNNGLLQKCLARTSACARVPCVDEVIFQCPLVITPEFLREHRIHAVGMSDEYVFKKDPVTGRILDCNYSYLPVKDYLVIIPRTKGFSSSELRDKRNSNDSFAEFRHIESMVEDVKMRMDKIVAALGDLHPELKNKDGFKNKNK